MKRKLGLALCALGIAAWVARFISGNRDLTGVAALLLVTGVLLASWGLSDRDRRHSLRRDR
jgi:hypothetical protein